MRNVSVRRVVVAVAALAGVIGGAFAGQTGQYVSVEPGPAMPVSTVLTVPETSPGAATAGDPLITTIAATDVTNLEALWCLLRGDCPYQPVPDRTATQSSLAQMRESLVAADAAADLMAGTRATHPSAPGKTAGVRGVGGPSAGLALALYLLGQRVDGDLYAGKTVAATGTIDADGNVGPVGGVSLKAEGAAAADADVFLVPVGAADNVRDTPFPVVEVAHLSDAVAWLCAHGGTSRLCPEGP